MDDVHQVVPRIYIGNSKVAGNYPWLSGEGITNVVNATSEIPNFFPDRLHYLTLGLRDTDEDIMRVLEPSYRYIQSILKYRPWTNVLIHCHAGISRSASIVIYYLMRSRKWDYDTALNFLRSKRSIVRPNPSYEKQLRGVARALSTFS